MMRNGKPNTLACVLLTFAMLATAVGLVAIASCTAETKAPNTYPITGNVAEMEAWNARNDALKAQADDLEARLKNRQGGQTLVAHETTISGDDATMQMRKRQDRLYGLQIAAGLMYFREPAAKNLCFAREHAMSYDSAVVSLTVVDCEKVKHLLLNPIQEGE